MKRVMGFWRSWGLVVGMMIGNGIFMLPAVLAPYGRLSLVGWMIAGIGTTFIALMFGLLAKRKAMVGGPYAYTRSAFGDLPAFMIGWGYWIGILAAVAAGAVAITGYIGFFIPSLSENPVASGLVSLLLIWFTTGINIIGVNTASIFQLVTSLVKILPLFIVAVAGLILGDISNAEITHEQQQPFSFTIAEIVMIVMWAYIGVEAITLPSDDVIRPENNIPKALIFGTLTATVIYIGVSYGVMALVPNSELANSTSPIADAASVIFGPWGAGLIAIGGLISIISATNANVFIVGVMPQALSEDKLLPKRFSQLNDGGAPAFSIIVSGVVASILVALNFSDGLMGAFKILILLSTLATLLPYVASALSELVLQQRDKANGIKINWISFAVASIALIFSIFAIIGSGVIVALQGIVLLAAGLPFYYWSKKLNRD